MEIRIALPKGRLMAETAGILGKARWGLNAYYEGTRSYRLQSERFPQVEGKIFHEKDIPIQVAVGNYDLGICSLDWIEELLAKYPSSALVKVRNLGYGESAVYAVASVTDAAMERLTGNYAKIVRIASEYPNLAESFALNHRFKCFNVFPLWGGAGAYPPDSAELALVSGKKDAQIFDHELVSVACVLKSSAYLIANRDSWESKDISEILASIEGSLPAAEECASPAVVVKRQQMARRPVKVDDSVIRLALPDGHQQEPTVEILNKAGIHVDDYPSKSGNRRPTTSLDGVVIKVIRPQDMPLQVANGNFDLAITGQDWLREHLYQFPSSPVTKLLDLGFGKVRIVAVVVNELPVTDTYSLRQYYVKYGLRARIASEYVNIADKYARDNHLGLYRVIPTWGATEAFLPEDADLLIENTQTGQTIARHNLKIIDTLFESVACLIGHKDSMANPAKNKRMHFIIEALGKAV